MLKQGKFSKEHDEENDSWLAGVSRVWNMGCDDWLYPLFIQYYVLGLLSAYFLGINTLCGCVILCISP
jgi:hypothetical protein